MTRTRTSRHSVPSPRAARRPSQRGSATPAAGSPSDHFRYALTPPAQASKETVTLAESTIAQLFDLDHHTPARILLPTAARHLDDIATLLRGTASKTLRQRLITSGGHAAALAGRLAFEYGDTSKAHHYWDSAMAAACDTANGPLHACVQMYLSHAAMQQGDHNTAWQFAHRAAEHAPEEPRAQAWIALQTAQAAARRGDSAAALAELKTAQDWDLEIGPPPAPDDDAAPWARFIDHAYLWAKAAHVHTHIGDTDNAHHAAVRAIDTLSSNQVKTRAIILAEAAYTFAHLGGTERALRHATDALELAETLEVTEATRRLHELIALLPKPLDNTGRELQRHLERAKTRRPGQVGSLAAAASEM